ncbi:MAG: hypothetical protein IK149_01685 [Oscillospiraceae bacterium]|nr:hypothetical protein [Oscillospiraceae bacterium]
MKQLMEYKIISGRVTEIRRSWMPVRKPGEPKPKRAPRVAGTSSEKKIRANEINSAREAARIINANFGKGDAHIVAKYDDDHLPGDYEGAEADLNRALRVLRRLFKARAGRNPIVFFLTANWSPKRNAPARLHQHLVLEREAEPIFREIWQGGGYSMEELDNRGDHSDLAAYLVANVQGRPNKKKWHVSRNVSRPIYTEPEPVADVEDIKPEKGSVIKAHETNCDEEGRVTSCYLRCLLPTAPRVRGGKVVTPKKEKRGGRHG